jgi:hypothetical protein
MKKSSIECFKSFIGIEEPDGLNAKKRNKLKRKQREKDQAEAEELQKKMNHIN